MLHERYFVMFFFHKITESNSLNTKANEINKTLCIAEPFNIIIRVLNTYIEKNKTKIIDNESGRKDDIKWLAEQVYQLRNSSWKFPYDFIENILSKKNLASVSPKFLPELEEKHFSHTTIYHLFEIVENLLSAISEYLKKLKTGALESSSLRNMLNPALLSSRKELEQLKKAMEAKKENDRKTVNDNLLSNETSIVMGYLKTKIPKEVLTYTLSFTSVKDKITLSKVSHFFNQITKEASVWIPSLKNNFDLTDQDLKKIKQNNESYPHLYFRVERICDLCVKIRETEREIMDIELRNEEDKISHIENNWRQNEIDTYKQSKKSHKEDLLVGLMLGEENLQAKFEGLIKRRETLLSPPIVIPPILGNYY